MILLKNLKNLRVLKLQGNNKSKADEDFYKYLVKGIKEKINQGCQLQKLCMNNLLGVNSKSSEYLYPVLKPNTELLSLDFSRSLIKLDDAKAIGKVLAEFRQIRELNLNNTKLTIDTTKEIADGLMRAK